MFSIMSLALQKVSKVPSRRALAHRDSLNSASYPIPKTRPPVKIHPLDNLGVLNEEFPFRDRQKNSGLV